MLTNVVASTSANTIATRVLTASLVQQQAVKLTAQQLSFVNVAALYAINALQVRKTEGWFLERRYNDKVTSQGRFTSLDIVDAVISFIY